MFDSLKHHHVDDVNSTQSSEQDSSFYEKYGCIPAKKSTMAAFSETELNIVVRIYQALDPNGQYQEFPPQLYRKMSSVTISNQMYRVDQVILAKSVFPLPGSNPSVTRTVTTDPTLRAAVIRSFCMYSLPCENEEADTQVFALVDWFMSHPLKDRVGKPYVVYCNSLFENSPENFLIPVVNISCILLTSIIKLEDENVLLTTPLVV